MPHYDRNFGAARSERAQNESVFDDDEEDAMDGAAQALREVEVEAVRPKPAPDKARLEDKSIDELRALAAKLDVPDRGAITVKEQLIAAIRARM